MKNLLNPLFIMIILFLSMRLAYVEQQHFTQEGILARDIFDLENTVSTLRNRLDIMNNIITLQEEEIKIYKEQIDELRTLRNVRVTAYAPLDNQSGICAEGDPTITSTGVLARRGVIAVDPSKIPYGTLLDVPEYGEGVANDTGGALRNYDEIAIDVFVDTYEEAMAWGVRYLDVKIK